MLIIIMWLCLIPHGYTKSIRSFDGSYHRDNFGVPKTIPDKYMRPIKRSGSGGSFHKLVPEHFGMLEHGPEIHLDIDEFGSRVDTHPSVLSLDTGTNAQEHCCHHCSECHHCCEGGCASCYGCCHPQCCEEDCCGYGGCCRRGMYEGNIHQNVGNNRHSGAQLLQHSVTPDTRGQSCMDDGEGDCSGLDDTDECYGGLCRNQIANNIQNQPFQISEHAAFKPLRSIYEAHTGMAQINPVPPSNYMVAQSQVKDEPQVAGYERITNDAHVEHGTGETRDTIGNGDSKETSETSRNDQPSSSVEHPPKLVTFGRSPEGLAFTNGELANTRSKTELIPYSKQDAIAIKRTIFKTRNILKYPT